MVAWKDRCPKGHVLRYKNNHKYGGNTAGYCNTCGVVDSYTDLSTGKKNTPKEYRSGTGRKSTRKSWGFLSTR